MWALAPISLKVRSTVHVHGLLVLHSAAWPHPHMLLLSFCMSRFSTA